eukprot:1929671-Rhodomonas_salina.1
MAHARAARAAREAEKAGRAQVLPAAAGTAGGGGRGGMSGTPETLAATASASGAGGWQGHECKRDSTDGDEGHVVDAAASGPVGVLGPYCPDPVAWLHEHRYDFGVQEAASEGIARAPAPDGTVQTPLGGLGGGAGTAAVHALL